MKASAGLQAYFKCVAIDADTGAERDLTDWFPNLVLDSGLDRMSHGQWFNRVLVGSGNSEPKVSQTQLDNFIASTTSFENGASARQLVDLPYYYKFTSAHKFAQGAAAGNLSEIAMGWADNACFNRALIRDVSGNPTTITVRQNEFLTVLVELRIYPQMTDSIENIDLLDEDGAVISTHTVTVRACMHEDHKNTSIDLSPGARAVRLGASTALARTTVFFAREGVGIASIKTLPDMNSAKTVMTHDVWGGYPTSRSCALKVQLAVNDVNQLHGTIFLMSPLGDWQLQYSPPILKNNTHTFEHNFMMLWNRYTGA